MAAAGVPSLPGRSFLIASTFVVAAVLLLPDLAMGRIAGLVPLSPAYLAAYTATAEILKAHVRFD